MTVRYEKDANRCCILHTDNRAEHAMSIPEAVDLIRELSAAIKEAAIDGRFLHNCREEK